LGKDDFILVPAPAASTMAALVMAGALYFMGRIFPSGKMLPGARSQYDSSPSHAFA
jgi:hypothetical protein